MVKSTTFFIFIRMSQKIEQLKEYEKLLDLDGEDEISEDLTQRINATLED
mgnify:CR=1 FL=1